MAFLKCPGGKRRAESQIWEASTLFVVRGDWFAIIANTFLAVSRQAANKRPFCCQKYDVPRDESCFRILWFLPQLRNIVRKKNFLVKVTPVTQKLQNIRKLENSSLYFLIKLKLFKDDLIILFKNHFQPKWNVKSLSLLFTLQRSSCIRSLRSNEKKERRSKRKNLEKENAAVEVDILQKKRKRGWGGRNSLKRRRFRDDAGVWQTEKTASGFSLISRVFFHTRPASDVLARRVKNE